LSQVGPPTRITLIMTVRILNGPMARTMWSA
jgi:hypothetical protein